MREKRTLIICASYHHESTMKIGRKIAEILNADIMNPKDFQIETIDNYDLIGFGSGIYNGKHHSDLLKKVEQITQQNGKKTFVFSTSTVPLKITHEPMNTLLMQKGFEIIGQFFCRGFMTYSFTKYFFGGLNKGRPNSKDLLEAEKFAREIHRVVYHEIA